MCAGPACARPACAGRLPARTRAPVSPAPDDPAAGATGSPSPALSPSQVVTAQLEGLRREPRTGAGPGPGVLAAWAFASPGNRAATGPVQRFAALLRTPAYAGLLGHRAAQLGPATERDDDARLEVLVLTADDCALGFTWVLSRRRSPPHDGCWLTDGVLRHPDAGDRPGGPR